MAMPGTLYLIPTSLGGDDARTVLAPETVRRVSSLSCFIVENPKTARHFLKAVGYPHPVQSVELKTLDEHTADAALPELLAPLLAGRDCGLLSEAGCPAVADPGAPLVRLAHQHGVRVVPLVGPSAVLLALMASGMNGQRFVFHGYLPVEKDARRLRLQELERDAARSDCTQIFIEAPYRNDALLQAILATCRGDTLLCLATDITLASEAIRTRTVNGWKKDVPALNRRPTVFLLYRGA